MKIDNTRPVSGVEPVRRERQATDKYRDTQTLAVPDPNEVISIAGIPEEELTPKVRAAITKLVQEVGELRQQVEMTRRRVAYLEQLADQDTLLPVYNRRAFVRELSRAMSYSERYNEPTSLIYLDLNGFKEVNDQYGHSAGDAALHMVARVLGGRVRESDMIGRLGGDEFGVILWRTAPQEAHDKAQELAHAIASETVDFEGHKFTIGAAQGTATFQGGKSVEELMADADAAMYENKVKIKGADQVR